MQYELTEIIQKISEIIKFDSSQSAPESGAPFGKGARASLDYFLNLAKSFGFETHDYRGYAGEVIFGEGKEFAVLAHLDVVPAGGGWTHEPFGGEIDCENKKIWGRGAMDDKGPAIIALYALKALKESGFFPKRKIKLIVGCNEENGWECIEYYKKHAHMPEEGISPDADFPVIFAEKGILQIKITYPVKGDFSSLKGGERANMVCGYCEIQRPENKEKLKTFGLTFKDGKIISKGTATYKSENGKKIHSQEVDINKSEYQNIQYEHFYTGEIPFYSVYGRGEFDKESLSYLRISNESSTDAVVLLCSENGNVLRNVFVRKNSEFTMKQIPAYRCIIKVMYGNNWYKEKDNGLNFPKGGFTSNVTYSVSKWSDAFDFNPKYSYEGVDYPTYELTLHKVLNGNFQTKQSNKNEFFNN